MKYLYKLDLSKLMTMELYSMFWMIFLMRVIRFKSGSQISKSSNLCGSHQGFASLYAWVPFSLSSQQIRNANSLQKHYVLIATQFHPLMDDDEIVDKESCTDNLDTSRGKNHNKYYLHGIQLSFQIDNTTPNSKKLNKR